MPAACSPRVRDARLSFFAEPSQSRRNRVVLAARARATRVTTASSPLSWAQRRNYPERSSTQRCGLDDSAKSSAEMGEGVVTTKQPAKVRASAPENYATK